MPESNITIDVHLYTKIDTVKLTSVGVTRESNPTRDYSRADVEELISWLEWFEPARKPLKQIRRDLLLKSKSIYKIIADIATGVYGTNKRLIQGADYFGIWYLKSISLSDFLSNLPKKVKRHGVQRSITPQSARVAIRG